MFIDATHTFRRDSKGEMKFIVHPVPGISADDQQSQLAYTGRGLTYDTTAISDLSLPHKS